MYKKIFIVLGCCLIIHYNNKKDPVIKFLSNKFMVGIGLISYSLYLWHHPILSFDKILNISKGDILIKVYKLSKKLPLCNKMKVLSIKQK